MALLLVLFNTSYVVSVSLLSTARHTVARQRRLSELFKAPVSGPSALPSYGGGLFDGGNIPETGPRVPVEDTTYFPFSAIGALEFTSYSTLLCTGALITKCGSHSMRQYHPAYICDETSKGPYTMLQACSVKTSSIR